MNARPFLFSLLCFSTPLFAQGAELDLRSTAKKGTSVWLVTVQKQEQTVEVGGQEMETGQTVTRTLHVSVLGEDGDNLLVETKIARIQGSAALPMGMGDVEFDSAAPAKAGEEEDEGMGGMGGMLKQAMLAGAGKSYRAKITRHGKVVELLDGSADLLESKTDSMAGGSLTKGDLERFVETAFGRVPEKATAVGAKWQHTDTREDGRMPMEQKLELTLVKADADSYEISTTGTVTKSEGKDGDKPAGGEEAEEVAMAREMMKGMKLSNGKFTGTQKVSLQDGFVLETASVMSVDAEFSGQMEMKMSVKSTTTTKRSTEEAAMPKKAEKAEPKKEEGKQDAGK